MGLKLTEVEGKYVDKVKQDIFFAPDILVIKIIIAIIIMIIIITEVEGKYAGSTKTFSLHQSSLLSGRLRFKETRCSLMYSSNPWACAR